MSNGRGHKIQLPDISTFTKGNYSSTSENSSLIESNHKEDQYDGVKNNVLNETPSGDADAEYEELDNTLNSSLDTPTTEERTLNSLGEDELLALQFRLRERENNPQSGTATKTNNRGNRTTTSDKVAAALALIGDENSSSAARMEETRAQSTKYLTTATSPTDGTDRQSKAASKEAIPVDHVGIFLTQISCGAIDTFFFSGTGLKPTINPKENAVGDDRSSVGSGTIDTTFDNLTLTGNMVTAGLSDKEKRVWEEWSVTT
mmetsp:Transcript_2461/g.3687  ORF Transcript_2461/g.3687 Transcript_2461/m.3687 type:complete len:260 (-) Transcript_2461:188-967(-)|eukprot:CAMPEP_0195526896 /NCGR_PEP_ID=MMETSP0794_2-20130614/28214_1 /TAXON_ID=515487 /ORGANISM="Stephanopyxis turris, Strain CCMP 815" /LENGTH=259 /DNA_ID=CAMNT_0040657683 /DNA_START=56 /DNA_END=835 /DNA_ORIENTATION=+